MTHLYSKGYEPPLENNKWFPQSGIQLPSLKWAYFRIYFKDLKVNRRIRDKKFRKRECFSTKTKEVFKLYKISWFSIAFISKQSLFQKSFGSWFRFPASSNWPPERTGRKGFLMTSGTMWNLSIWVKLTRKTDKNCSLFWLSKKVGCRCSNRRVSWALPDVS